MEMFNVYFNRRLGYIYICSYLDGKCLLSESVRLDRWTREGFVGYFEKEYILYVLKVIL